MTECGVAPAPPADLIRLTLPADPEMVSVLTVAVRVASVRLGLSDRDVDAARSKVVAAFDELAVLETGSPVEVELLVTAGQLRIRLHHDDEERTVRIDRS